MEITFIMLGSLNHKSWWRSFVKTPMMMLSAYLLFGCKNILMSDATRSLLLFRNRGEGRLAPSPVWAALRDNKPGILCWLIITNKTHNNSFPSPAWHHSLLSLSGLPCPSLELETKKRIHHPPKRVGTIRQREPQYWDQSPSICSPPSLAWEPSYNGQ